ncbi:hypothetical protein V8F20_006633 [Naviculisporaceae sp. PSN 640]
MEVLGAIAAAASLSKLVAKVILKFGTRQNAPRQVKRLEHILEDLNDKHLIESAPEKDRERLRELISVAEETLQNNFKKPNPIVQFFWPEDAEERLRILNDELRDELVAIGLKVDRSYRASILVSPVTPTLGIPTPSSSTNTSPAFPAAQSPKSSHPTQARRPTFDLTASAPTIDRKKGHELPATLYLQSPNGVDVVGPLKVKYIRVLERDESTRLIHYERKTANHHLEVTHRIPRSCLRFEDDNLNDKQVHFLDPHPITVVRTGKGHEVFFLHAKYEFTSVEYREDFISRMLERELLGRFYAEEILYRGLLHAQGTVVRLWRKGEDTGPSSPGSNNDKKNVVTRLTYLAREERQWEWDLKNFERRVDVDEVAGRVTLVEADQGTEKASLVIIKFTPPPRTRKQSTPNVSTTGTGTAKKRERTLSSQTTIIPGPEDKIPSSPTTTAQQPERKRSTWSLRRFSRTSVTSIGKETLSPDMGMRSPDLTGPRSAASSPAMSYASHTTDNSQSSSHDTTSFSGPHIEGPKSDAERFKEVWKNHHPLCIPELESLPPIVATVPIGLGGWDGLGVETGGGGNYTRSPSTSPRASPLPTSAPRPQNGPQGSETVKGSGAGIQPTLKGLYPP